MMVGGSWSLRSLGNHSDIHLLHSGRSDEMVQESWSGYRDSSRIHWYYALFSVQQIINLVLTLTKHSLRRLRHRGLYFLSLQLLASPAHPGPVVVGDLELYRRSANHPCSRSIVAVETGSNMAEAR